tara:strand:- start:3502 stop:5430 length:1929 start_codon:yes stop_codon:yes gene_type:complete
MSEELARMVIVLEAQTAQMERNLRKAARLTDGKLDQIDNRVKKSGKRFKSWGSNFTRSIQVGLAAAVVLAGKNALQTADKIDILQDRIKDATRESGGFQEMWDGITKTAIETGGAIEDNVALVQRLAIAAKDLGGTNAQFLQLNDTVQKLGIISGATTAGMRSGTVQLAQGLGEGIFRAQEFNSILENIPAVAEAISKSLGKSTSELRKMVLAGKLSSKMVFEALLASTEEVEERVSKIPPRMSRAWGGFVNAMSLNIDGLNEKFGFTETLAKSLVFLTDKMKSPDFSLMPGGQEYNDLLEERRMLLLAIDRDPEAGFMNFRFLPGLNKELAEVEARIKEIVKEGLVKPKGAEEVPDRATPDSIQPKFKDLIKAKPFRLTDDEEGMFRSREINDSIQDRISLEAHSADMLGRTASEAERLNLEFEINKELQKDGITISDEQRVSMKRLLDMYQEELVMTGAITDELERKKQQFEALENIADQFAEDFGQVFINSVANGENALDSLGRAFKNTLIKMAADALIIAPLQSIFKGAFGGGGVLGGFASALGGLFGAKAAGGDVQGGKPYLVGENGPEIFSSKSAGRISPNRSVGGGGSNVIVNQNITLSPDVSPTIAAQIMQAAPFIADEARRRVAEDLAGQIIT